MNKWRKHFILSNSDQPRFINYLKDFKAIKTRKPTLPVNPRIHLITTRPIKRNIELAALIATHALICLENSTRASVAERKRMSRSEVATRATSVDNVVVGIDVARAAVVAFVAADDAIGENAGSGVVGGASGNDGDELGF